MKTRLITALICIGFLPLQARPAAQARGDFEISGRLVNSVTGEAIRGATMQLAPVTERSQTQHVDSASDGSFAFRSLPAAKYSLSALAQGYPPQFFEQHGQFNTGVVTGPDKTSTGLIFRLNPEGAISGKVLDEHNEPVRTAQILLFEKSNDTGRRLIERRSQAQTNDLGEYHLTHLREGTYYLALAAQPWYRRYLAPMMRSVGTGQPKAEMDPALDVAFPVTYYPGTTDADGAGALIVHPGDRLTADFDLTPVQSLHLTIPTGTSEGGPPMQPNFRERVFGEPWGFVQPNIVWGQGEIQVSGIAPGDYEVNFSQRGNRRPDGMDFSGPGERSVKTQQLNLQSDGELDPSSGVDLESIHGTIKFEGASPPNNSFIQLRDLNTGRLFGARADAKGEFQLQPRHAGRYVMALANAPGYAIQSISATGARVSGRTIEFTGTQAAELTVKASQGVGTINGTVMNGDKPLSGALVMLVPPDVADNISLFRRDQSDSDGTFILNDVVPGSYTAVAIQNGWDLEWASPEALRPYLAKGTRVEITGKQALDIKVAAQ